MINKTIFNIFQNGSKTYFYSSLFFPTYLKKDVFTLYGFVRKADNYVDAIPQDVEGFYSFKEKYYKAINGEKNNDTVVNLFANLVNVKNLNKEWIDAFLYSMEMDIKKNRYKTLDDTIEYIYGSAEVIGLMMAKIMDLPKESFYYSKYLGRSMQYINFIRDIAEDIKLDRIYFPYEDLKEFDLLDLSEKEIKNKKENYKNFIKKQIMRYCKWQKIAEEGYRYIPKRYLIPIKTASEMYNWTAEQAYKDPFIVYDMKVKPRIFHIVTTSILNMVDTKNTIKLKGVCPFKRLLAKNESI